MKKPTVEEAWKEFFASQKLDSLDDVRADGWKTREEVCEKLGVSKNVPDRMPGLESRIFRVAHTSGIRSTRFFRPKGV
jgi:hypothetical protein